ncbi:MAG: hypothetical protein Q8S44_01710 [Flavobacteriaceae bacterium]|nr:hypothetical protein [Flavobacteriaceae bacterium]
MKSSKYYVRKIHRYLGVFIGIQFFLWTIGGLYFAWTNINEIRGKHLIHEDDVLIIKNNMKSPDEVLRMNQIAPSTVKEIKLSSLFFESYYFVEVNDNMMLINSATGKIRDSISELDARKIAVKKLKKNIPIRNIEYVTNKNIDQHFQYRGGMLPAWAVELDDDSNTVLYICALRGTLERVRTKEWRIFDFLWMLHIMDFDERDNINNSILRGFSILGLITIMSGFVLFFQSSPTFRKLFKQKST